MHHFLLCLWLLTLLGKVTANHSCQCGYRLALNDAYFPYKLQVDFTKLTSLDDLATYNLSATTGNSSIGGTNPANGVSCYGAVANYRFTGSEEGLQLIVPGQQPANNITGAELTLDFAFLNGVVTAEFKLSPVPGTVQALFTYSNDTERSFDEQDIEALGASLLSDSSISPGGIQLTNYDPTDLSDKRSSHVVDPFPFDPTVSFNNYTIAWLPNNTTYYLNDRAIPSPPLYFSLNPSVAIINHWSNGDTFFSQGPPTSDAILSVRTLTIYYALPEQYSLLPGCNENQVCMVGDVIASSAKRMVKKYFG